MLFLRLFLSYLSGKHGLLMMFTWWEATSMLQIGSQAYRLSVQLFFLSTIPVVQVDYNY